MSQYDNEIFFEEYSKMSRSVDGLKGAGEWHAFQKLMPDFQNKKVLDLGCGYGWHCAYAIRQGASEVLGIDASEKMLEEARKRNPHEHIAYVCADIEKMDYSADTYDVVLSSLVIHYVLDYASLVKKIHASLKKDGIFVFSLEHPIFTAQGKEEWICDENGKNLYWPVDHYFSEGERNSIFLGCKVKKVHRTLTTLLMTLLQNGFVIEGVVEPEPDPSMLDWPGMKDELRRPMMLLIRARKVTK